MILLLRAISSRLALSWLAPFSLSRTSCSCLTLSCSTACLKAARSLVSGWSCCAKSDRAMADGSAAFGATASDAACEGGIVGAEDHHQATPMDAANREQPKATWRQFAD